MRAVGNEPAGGGGRNEPAQAAVVRVAAAGAQQKSCMSFNPTTPGMGCGAIPAGASGVAGVKNACQVVCNACRRTKTETQNLAAYGGARRKWEQLSALTVKNCPARHRR